MTCFPCNANFEFLVELIMCYSKLEKLWEGIKSLRSLKWMDLSDSVNLKELPDLSTATNLEKLDLRDCSTLIKLPSLPGNSLGLLNISGCSSLVEFPSFIGNAVKLQKLYLGNCFNLVELPDLSTATNLEILNLRNCSSLTKFPSLSGNSLEALVIGGCSSLVEFPSFIGNAVNLRKLHIRGWLKLVEFPDLSTITDLDELTLDGCQSLIKLPSLPGCSFIGNAVKLRRLNVTNCLNLVELPDLSTATNLEELNLRDCWSLMKFPSLPGNSLEILDINGCSSLVEFPSFIGNAVNLRKLHIRGCLNLVELPDLSTATYLEELNLLNCSSLTKLPSLPGNSLELLNISGCSSLVEFPSSIGNVVNLRELDLSSLPNLLELPSFVGNATKLEELDLSNCLNLVELPLSLGNLQMLRRLILKGCSKLEVLPTNIILESLTVLDLFECHMLKFFPQISTKISFLNLIGTAIEQVPPSIRSWPYLNYLEMSYFENLKDFPHALERITYLCLADTVIQEVPPWVKKIVRLRGFVLNGCRKLVSIPPISKSISIMDARDCESLEILECSFHNPLAELNFANCFKLNQEARDLIITNSCRYAVLPGGQVPEYFTHRATGGGPLTIKFNEKPLSKSMTFKACILLLNNGDHEVSSENIMIRHKNGTSYLWPALAEHLYTFQFQAKVTSSELFEFKLESDDIWKIGECGLVVQDLEEVPWY